MFKYILLISLILLSLISCNKTQNAEEENIKKRVEIILSDENSSENIEVKEYDEEKLKQLALSSLKEFYLPSNLNNVDNQCFSFSGMAI